MKGRFALVLILGSFSTICFEQVKGVVYRIDVSHFQGDIDWQKVAKTELKFVFIKLTYGENSVDSKFAKNWEGSASTDLLRGTYYYFDPKLDALKQAKHFAGKTGREFGDFPPIVDIEAFEKQKNQTVIKELKIFLDEVEKTTQCKPIIIHTKWVLGSTENP